MICPTCRTWIVEDPHKFVCACKTMWILCDGKMKPAPPVQMRRGKPVIAKGKRR